MFKVVISVLVLACLGLVYAAPEQPKSSVNCTLCLTVATLLDKALQSGKTQQELIQLLEQACNPFPASLKSQCLAFINEYGAYVLELVAAQIDPQTTCDKLKLCP